MNEAKREPGVARGPGRGPMLIGLVLLGGMAVLAYVLTAPAAPRPTATPTAASTLRAVRSSPPGARATLDGHELGNTPTVIDLRGLEGRPRELRLQKPGYQALVRTVTPTSADIAATLQPVEGFVGTWRAADGTQRQLERDGASVRVTIAPGTALQQVRRFEFLPTEGDGPCVFTGVETDVGPGSATSSPGCEREAGARMEYDASTGTLLLTVESLRVERMAGECIVTERLPGRGQTLTRVLPP